MEALSLLENKIIDLVTIIKKLKQDNVELAAENKQLAKKVNDLQDSVSTSTCSIKELNQEKEVADLMVTDLIKSIDSLVQSEQK